MLKKGGERRTKRNMLSRFCFVVVWIEGMFVVEAGRWRGAQAAAWVGLVLKLHEVWDDVMRRDPDLVGSGLLCGSLA